MRIGGILFLSTMLMISLAAAAPPEADTFGSAPASDPPRGTTDIPPGLADRDGDGLSDSLKAALDSSVPGEQFDVVVTFAQSGRSAAQLQQAVGPFSIRDEFRVIHGFAATMTAAQVNALAGTPGLHRIEEDFVVTVMIDGATADFGSNQARIDFTVDGSGAAMGRPVGVCVIDTGVNAQHEQLDNGKVAGFFDAVNGLPNPYDDQGHGTHVASIAVGDGVGGPDAATYRGVAPGAALFAAKAMDEQGSGTDSDILAAIDWCVGQSGVDIVSLSIGTIEGSDGQDSLSQAVNCIADPNWSTVCGTPAAEPKVVVVAAGNHGPAPETVGSPGAAEKAITVGAAANYSGDGRGVYLAAFSSRGPTLDGRVKPDIAAPGVRITAASYLLLPTDYVTHNGTSMATPFVSGVVALMLDANPQLRLADPVSGALPADRIRALLSATGQDRGPDGPNGGAADNEYGIGLIDAYAAVAEATGLASGQYEPTRFPKYRQASGSVPANGEWLSDPFDVAGDGTPLAATITLDGNLTCSLGSPGLCSILGGWVWSPDLDMELIDATTGAPVPAGNGDITLSECPLAGEFCGVGRQETVKYLPPGPGSYQIRVYSFEGAGSFALELSGVDTGLVADAGPDQTLFDTDADGVSQVTLDGSNSSHDNGIIVSYGWSEGQTVIAAGATATVDLDVGPHLITLTVTDEAGETDTDVVSVDVRPNVQPTAAAGGDQTVTDNDDDGSENVVLDGRASIDTDGGTIVSYQWFDNGAPIATGALVTVPLAVGTHAITLNVTDNGGASDVASATVTVLANQFPIADAGPDQTVNDNDGDGAEAVLLDGGASTDPGGAIVSFTWSQGGTVLGNGETLGLSLAVGTHDFTLTVTDAAGVTASDAVTVVVEPNQAPLAYAGADLVVTDFDGRGTETFTLDGSGSSDPGGAIVSFEWSEAGVAVGSGATLAVTREVGAYVFTLTVLDAAGVSASDDIAVTVKPDPYADKVVLFTHLDGPDGATTALDESTSNHALTFNGTAQLDTAQSRFGAASALFGGSEITFISAADSDDWHFGAGEFTVEAWVRFSSVAAYSVLIDHADFATDQISWRLDWTPDNNIRFLYSSDGTNTARQTLSSPWSPQTGTWYHVAIDRDASGTLRVYVDGAVLIESVVTTALHNSTAGLKVGERHAGWIDEVRITKGAARYQGAFAQPNKPATFDDIVLLTGFDGVDGSTVATDESNSGHVVAFNGAAQIDTSQSRFGGGAVQFTDTDTTFVSVADSDDWHFGDGPFTVEGWIQFSSVGTYSVLFDQADFAGEDISWRLDWTPDDHIRLLYSPDGTNASRITLSAPWAPIVGAWYHVAVDRDANHNLRVYVDGKPLINVVVTAAFHNSDAALKLGERHAGWIDEVRITKGAAQYAGSFTPPAKTPDFGDVKLLAHLDGPDGATAAVDESNGNHTLTFAGAASLDGTTSRFGDASARFDDSAASFIAAADSDEWHFGAGEFTVEAWIRFSSLGNYSPLIDQADFAANQVSWRVDWTSANQLRFLYSTDGSNAARVTLTASWAPEVDRWYHVAVDRDSAKRLRIYVDGQVLLEAETAVAFHDSTAGLKIGALHAGWIDEIRITKGVAQYGGPFTPPDAPHPGASGSGVAAIP